VRGRTWGGIVSSLQDSMYAQPTRHSPAGLQVVPSLAGLSLEVRFSDNLFKPRDMPFHALATTETAPENLPHLKPPT
jgi:hypothetical protein